MGITREGEVQHCALLFNMPGASKLFSGASVASSIDEFPTTIKMCTRRIRPAWPSGKARMSECEVMDDQPTDLTALAPWRQDQSISHILSESSSRVS